MTGVPTGFAELDALTNGFHPGQLIIVAARPALGKSTLALDFARAASIKHDMPSIFFSLEMGRSEIAMRLLSAEASVPLQSMRKGTVRRAGLDEARRDPRPHQRRPALHRRQPQHDAGRDPRQVPPAQAEGRPEARRHRLPAADDVAARRSRPASRRSREFSRALKLHGEGAPGARHRALAAEPWPRAARRQEARHLRPARVRARSSRTPTWSSCCTARAPTRRTTRARARPTSSSPSTATARPTPSRWLPRHLLPLRRHADGELIVVDSAGTWPLLKFAGQTSGFGQLWLITRPCGSATVVRE